MSEYEIDARKVFKKFPINFQLELEADERLSFDDVAKCAIYKHADVLFKPECDETIEKFQNISKLAKSKSFDELLDMSWEDLYNQKFSDILIENDIKTRIDKGGSLGWIDEKGKHFGDQYLFFPFYTDKKTLVKAIKKEIYLPFTKNPP